MGKLYALIGHPVAHSLSPIMHNEQFRRIDLPYHYESFDVPPDQLKDAVLGMRALGIAGFNVTVPHKVDVMQHLDEIDDEAKRIGAVNTVINENGRLLGSNTDGEGFLLSLKDVIGQSLTRQRVLIIGAGGAARGIAVALDRHGVKQLNVANRTVEKAQMLTETCMLHTPSRGLSLEEAAADAGSYELIINTTPIGMSPDTDSVPVRFETIAPGTVMADLIYNPIQTKWLKEGEKQGAVTMNGVGMFVNQGALAFERWTGRKPDRRAMRETVLAQLS